MSDELCGSVDLWIQDPRDITTTGSETEKHSFMEVPTTTFLAPF
jgi:hypothetical protein